MRDVYSKAQRTTVWLGDDDDNDQGNESYGRYYGKNIPESLKIM
jgi:hypothetical protein